MFRYMLLNPEGISDISIPYEVQKSESIYSKMIIDTL